MLAPAGPPRHTRGMDPEREDYADRNVPPVWLPPVGLLVVASFLLFVSPCLLIGLLATGKLSLP